MSTPTPVVSGPDVSPSSVQADLFTPASGSLRVGPLTPVSGSLQARPLKPASVSLQAGHLTPSSGDSRVDGLAPDENNSGPINDGLGNARGCGTNQVVEDTNDDLSNYQFESNFTYMKDLKDEVSDDNFSRVSKGTRGLVGINLVSKDDFDNGTLDGSWAGF